MAYHCDFYSELPILVIIIYTRMFDKADLLIGRGSKLS